MTTMTKRNFEFIAETIQSLRVLPEERMRIAEEFADALAVTNERFNRARFLAACVRPRAQDLTVGMEGRNG